MNETEMIDLIERSGAALHPDVDRLVAAGADRGRRRRLRARAGAATGTTEPSATAPARPPVRQLAVPPKRTGATLAERVAALVGPGGEITAVESWTHQPAAWRAGSLLLDGAQVNVIVERTESACEELPPGRDCVPVAGGGWLVTATYDEPMAGQGGGAGDVVASTATYVTDDRRFAVTMTAWNAAAEKGAGALLPEPVLDEQALAALAQDPVWLTRG